MGQTRPKLCLNGSPQPGEAAIKVEQMSLTADYAARLRHNQTKSHRTGLTTDFTDNTDTINESKIDFPHPCYR